MEFRLPLPEERKQVEDLWAYCFEPRGDAFFEYYFEHCYEPENILVGVENGQVVSDIHLRQYLLNVRGAMVPVSYIVGVATHPAARRGGVGGELLRHSLQELKRRGQGLTILMPSKAAFYQQYGWELYCHQWVQTMPLEELRPLTDKTMTFGLLTSVEEWKLLAPVYEGYTKGLSGFAVRSEADWRRLLGSFEAEGVKVAYVKGDNDEIEGYVVYRLGAPEIVVSEMMYTTRRGQKGLFNYLYNHRSQGHTVRWNEGMKMDDYLFWPDGKEGHQTMPFMMSRVVEVSLAMESIPVTSKDWATAKESVRVDIEHSPIYLTVEDPLVDENSGTYKISFSDSKGQGQATVSRVTDDVQVDGVGEDVTNSVRELETEGLTGTITIGALGLLLMGRLQASELAFEGRLTGSETLISLLDALYPKQKTFINEWW